MMWAEWIAKHKWYSYDELLKYRAQDQNTYDWIESLWFNGKFWGDEKECEQKLRFWQAAIDEWDRRIAEADAIKPD